MKTTKNAVLRTAALVAASALMAAGSIAPAMAGHDRGNGKSHDDRSANARADKPANGKSKGKSEGRSEGKGSRGQGSERGNGHTPVTVCHLLGNGSYNILTFDENALSAHVDNHGDIYPVPEGGCPESSEDVRPPNFQGKDGHVRVTVCHLLGNGSYNILTFDQHALRAHEAHGDLYPVPADGCPTETVAGEETPGEETPGDDADVAGVEGFGGGSPQADAEVLGVEATVSRSRAAAAFGPLAGILPQTGAAQVGLAAAAGLLLLGAGATMIARRRSHGAL